MGDRPRRVSARKRRFLKAFSLSANLTEAAKAAGVHRSTPYRWAEEDEHFKAEMDAAEGHAIDRVEGVAFDLATGEYEKAVVSGGKLLGTEKIYSERMIELILKARRPTRYIERRAVEHSGKIKTIQQLLSDIPDDGE